MTRPLPTLEPRQVIRALQRGGLRALASQRSHHYFRHQSHPELLVCVPVHPGDLKRPVLRSILRQANLTVDAFLDLL